MSFCVGQTTLADMGEAVREPQWVRVNKGTPLLVAMADRHYTRQTAGSNQACRPGFNFCLLLSDGRACWVVWRPRPDVGRKDNLEAWECTMFRNEGARLSSTLIEEATHLTYCEWGWPPRDGLISAIGVDATKRGRSRRSKPGACFLHAGWTYSEKKESDEARVWLEAPRPMRTAAPADGEGGK